MAGSIPPHRIELDVRFREVDAYGVVWHGHYFDWLESARHHFAAHFGFDIGGALARGLRLPMLECQIEFRSPARLGDRVAVDIELDPDPRRVLAFRYRVRSTADDRLLAVARTVQVAQGEDGSLRLGWPAELVDLLEAMRRYEAGRELAAGATGSSTQNRVP